MDGDDDGEDAWIGQPQPSDGGLKIEVAIESAFDTRPVYLASQLVEAWRDRGHDVRVRSLTDRSERPDVALLHVDRSVIPQSLVQQLGYDCPLVNGEVLDITKRRISRQLVTYDDASAGPVIVKTDENCARMG